MTGNTMIFAYPQLKDVLLSGCSRTVCALKVPILKSMGCCRVFALGLAALAMFQPTTVRAAEECGDEYLHELVQLIDDRLALAQDVARYKWTAKLPIEDLAREQAIIHSMGRQAADSGLPLAWSEAFFRAQIEASKREQRALFAKWQHTHPKGFNNPPHLTEVTRPKLDAINNRLFAILARAWAQISNPLCQSVITDLVAARQPTSALGDPSALALAIAPVTAGAAY